MTLYHHTWFKSRLRSPLHFHDFNTTRQRSTRSQCRPPTDESPTPDNEQEVSRILQETKKLMKEVQTQTKSKTSRVSIPQNPSSFATNQEGPLVTLHCDVSGCTIAPVDGRNEDTLLDEKEEISEFLLKGKGWKIGRKQYQEKTKFSAFVGGDDWSISLTQEEYEDFIKLLDSLRRGVATLEVCGDWGKEGSEATLEMGTARVWLQGRASQSRLTLLSRLWSRKSLDVEELPTVAFSLRFVIRSDQQREVEGSWDANIVMEVLKALDEKSEIL